MDDPDRDERIRELREQVFAVDLVIVRDVNERLRLVAELKRYKESRGVDFVDRARERWIVEELSRRNPGPLSDEGLRELYAHVLKLTKREIAGPGAEPAA